MSFTEAELKDMFFRALWTGVIVAIAAWPGAALVASFSGHHTDLNDLANSVWGILGPVVLGAVSAAGTVIRVTLSNKVFGTGTATTKEVPALGLPVPVTSVNTKSV